MINRQVLKRKTLSQRVRELSCSQPKKQAARQTDIQTNKQAACFTLSNPLASLITQPINMTASLITTAIEREQNV